MCEYRDEVFTQVVAVGKGKADASVRLYDDGKARVRFSRDGERDVTTPPFTVAEWRAIVAQMQTMSIEAAGALPDALPEHVKAAVLSDLMRIVGEEA